MEKNINLAKILNGKPVNTKLWSPLFGDVYTSSICSEDTIIIVNHHAESSSFYNNGKYFNHAEAELLLFPSKEMRDWSKFAWKKGDILVNKDAEVHIIFDGFKDDTYKTFHGHYYLWEEEGSIVNFEENEDYMQTSEFYKANKEEAQTYIKTIEERLGGKLNLETLEIEKQLEFKDGDIVVAEEDNYYDKVIFIAAIKDTIVSKALINVRYEDYEVHYNEYRFGRNRSLRLATDSEKRQLFDALDKEGKAWNAETKTLEYLPKKCEFKPFDKVLVRNTDTEEWFPGFFEKFDSTWNNPYHIMNRRSMTDFAFKQCISYEGNEHLLGTTKDVED